MAGLAQSYHLVATLLFVVVSAVVSMRLLLLARRTKGKPELLLGLGLLGTAVLGYGVLIASALVRGLEKPIATTFSERALQAAGQILHDAGVSMILLFVLSVFRAGQRPARALAVALLVALWGGALGSELENGFRNPGIGNGFWWLRYAVFWTYPLWTAVESYRYYAMMRRRVALGLADPVVANRFWLWGAGSLGTALATWTASSPLFLASDPARMLAWTPVIQLATATIGVVTVALYSLTFFPPPAYQRWVAGGAPPARQG
jgi:hypothetical protein